MLIQSIKNYNGMLILEQTSLTKGNCSRLLIFTLQNKMKSDV